MYESCTRTEIRLLLADEYIAMRLETKSIPLPHTRVYATNFCERNKNQTKQSKTILMPHENNFIIIALNIQCTWLIQNTKKRNINNFPVP